MKAKDIYGLAVRAAGLIGMMKVISHWFRFWHQKHYLLGDHLWEFIFEILLMLIGIFMVTAAPFLLSLLNLDADDKDS